MLLKLIYRWLAFDRRAEPLDHERRSAEMACRVWDGLLPSVPATQSSQFAQPPLTYAQSRFSMFLGGGNTDALPRDAAAGKARATKSPTTVRGMAQSVLKKNMPPHAQMLLQDALDDGDERRAFGREPFVHPATFQLENDKDRHSAFIRDISVGGMGLLHFVAIEPQRITVQTRRPNDQVIQLVVDIAWCVPCGEGCYMSGGTFVTPWTG